MDVNDDFERTVALLFEEIPAVIGGGGGVEATAEPVAEKDAVLGTIGFGGPDLRGSIVLGERYEDTVERVDNAMYRAKAAGRNRVVVASAELVTEEAA